MRLSAPTTQPRSWPLATKLVAVGAAFLLLALASIGLTLWVTWQLEGGAAAVNETGRVRMLTYRLALELRDCSPPACRVDVRPLDRILQTLRDGDPARPLMVPRGEETARRYAGLQASWLRLRAQMLQGDARSPALAPAALAGFVGQADGFVRAIEQHLARWTAILHAVQMTMLMLAVGSAVALLYAGHLLVLNPVARLQQGVDAIRDEDFSARVTMDFNDEFGRLAAGFNRMAEHLQDLYGQLEHKVREKTAGLEARRQRLAALYDVSSFIAQADSLPQLADGFASRMRAVAQADAVVVRWSGEGNERYLLLASDGLPGAMSEAERCLPTAACHCGQPQASAATRVIPIAGSGASLPHCGQAGYATLVSVPVRLQQRLLGEIDLFFHLPQAPGEEERSLYEALAAHLASALEGLRAAAMEKEAAVAGERTLIAQELHDSIAQSLAFLKIQVQLLRDALRREDADALQRALGELDAGVRESYADVRELLVHFRTRTNTEDIEPALRTTLQKFEHQSGVPTRLEMSSPGLPLPPDVQVQVLHVLQEALSNVRKHADATQVVLRARGAPHWHFEVLDDGRGFDQGREAGETHVGLRIMRERAARIGGRVEVVSTPDQGTRVLLDLPPEPASSIPIEAAPAAAAAS